jgi:hypothetical protein
MTVALPGGELLGLEAAWSPGLEGSYQAYLEWGPPRVALAAAFVERAVELHGLGQPAARATELLMGDLCLARASRLLADEGDQRLQVQFALVVERVASAAAAREPVPAARELLLAAIGAPG